MRSWTCLRGISALAATLALATAVDNSWLGRTQIPLFHYDHLHEGDARLGAVASENDICSQIGVDLLRQGGNAADAVCV